MLSLPPPLSSLYIIIHLPKRELSVETEVISFIVNRMHIELNETARKLIGAVCDSEYEFAS